MSEHQKHFPEFYVTSPQPCPYLPGRLERKLFTHLTRDKPVALVDGLLKGGFRRSQNIAYMPYCEGCHACVSTRVVVADFVPTRSMRRVGARNRDLAAVRLPSLPTPDQYMLFRRYIDARHAGGGMADMSPLDYATMVEDSVLPTFQTEYRVRPRSRFEAGVEEWPLAAVALTDRLSDGLSMVYSFFDPDAQARSLGTYMILEHIEHTQRLGLPYLYLGYWIEASPKMSYKARFTPQERLGPGGWVRV
jgi:arginine-tRNA-protein transferase